ncbi:O-antigen/teichoic acid export membrane protein [Paenibacillus baekrokdamisoli]|nr:polysaccharide biosynthesis protein [Paenibacillus baekrokdamisoli]MBB3072992.1 O-antigen/teichoic acid export membrane protein [Paenibacillus baekrokdamisoli]
MKREGNHPASSTDGIEQTGVENRISDYRQQSQSTGLNSGVHSKFAWRGAVLMGVAMLMSKTIGTLQKIPLQNVAGDRVFGIYNAVYPLYQLLLVMVTAGFPVAVSLVVAEHEAVGERSEARHVLRASILLLAGSGIAGFALLWFGAGRVALWIGDPSTGRAIQAAALALWFMPVMAALRGYYQGRGQMLPSAVSQLTEQLVRVTAMLTLLWIGWQYGWSDASLAAGATSGSAFGGAAGLAVMLVHGLRERRAGDNGGETESASKRELTGMLVKDKEEEGLERANWLNHKGVQRREKQWSGRGTKSILKQVRRLAALAIPITLGALAVPALSVVDAFTVPRLLRGAGMNEIEAMSLFGIYGRGLTLVQLVVMVAGAIGGALVPALATARTRGDVAAMRQQATIGMRAAWAIGAAASIGLVLLAEPINVMLYADNEGSRTFALVGWTGLAGTVNAIAAAMLQGLGKVRAPALFMLAAAVLKAALNAALVPAFGTAGAACAGIAALAAAALLSAAAVRRAAGAAMPARGAAGIALALAAMAAALALAERGAAALLGPVLPPRAEAAALALGGVALGGAVFAAAALRFGGISARELRALPGGEAIAARLRKWRLLPSGGD